MKQRDYHIGPGAASLLLVVVVVSMSVLGLLALINARGDYRLTERARALAEAEYAMASQAEEALAELDGMLADCAQAAENDEEYLAAVKEALPGDMQMSERTVSWTHSTADGRMLRCAVEITPHGSDARFVWTEHVYFVDAGMDDGLM